MSSLQTIKAQIRNLISISNAKTERTDADLTSAVGALIEGYGQSSEVEDYALYMSSANEGGFSAYAGAYGATYDFTCFAPEVTFGEEMIVAAYQKYQKSYGCGCVISEKIDLTGYAKIVFDYECTIPEKSANNSVDIFISTTKQPLLNSVSVYEEVLLDGKNTATSKGTKEIDVSALSGEYYIGFSMFYTNSASIKVSNMYMEGVSEQGGGSGGGSAEIPTCKVRFVSGENATTYNVWNYTKYENGEFSTVTVREDENITDFDITFENVVCGSTIYFHWTWNGDWVDVLIDGTATQLPFGYYSTDESPIFAAPTVANEVCTITINSPMEGGDDWWG